jgi:hypothetical protein
MPRVLFTANSLENGVYTCHVRVGFASAPELQDFLTRNTLPERDGWGVVIHRGPARGYDGKPLYQADIWLSTALSTVMSSVARRAKEEASATRLDEAVAASLRRSREADAPPPWQPALTVRESVQEGNGYESDQERSDVTPSEHLTWEQRSALQKATQALLLALGVADRQR